MMARAALVLERFFLGIARWLAGLAGKPPLDDPPASRTLTDAEIERIAERALDRALQIELRAPEITAWQESTSEVRPQQVRRYLRADDD